MKQLLGMMMPTGYYSLRERNNSSEAIQWLEHFSNENIMHAENSIHGEVRIENYSVDGLDPNTNTIYGYYGCYYHGHACNELAKNDGAGRRVAKSRL